ncbi:helix-turn-helix domain-containing protein [Desulfovibrio sp. OttesenSCG-928-F07]|nr:helix-turn-helix domain-containing protein [Desulfovibrio sp. OttesenSCG-928-F07]
MSEKTVTHKDLADKLGVSETTIKSYRRKFPGCFPVASKGKPIRFKTEATDMALRIRDLFSTGMSVEEVRERLVEEFDWYNPKEGAKPRTHALKTDIPQNFATAVSNMAKSMITLSQQQATILDTMKRIELMLAEVGGSAFKNIDPAASRNENKAIMAEIATLKADMGNIAHSLAESNSMMSEERNAFMVSMERVVNAVVSGPATAGQHKAGNVINFNSSANSGVAHAAEAMYSGPTLAEAAAVSGAMAGQSSVNYNNIPEFPRHILAMPLVVRNDEGAYLSAGGKNISRISLNDIKAILAQTYMPPENFSMSWSYKDGNWWINFEQRSIPAPLEAINISIQVVEITSARGVSVLEARKYIYNDNSYHPTELVRFVTGAGKE